MDIIIALISIDIVASKFLDSYVTYYRLKGTEEKRKSIFGRLLERAGLENDIWPSFFMTLILVMAAAYSLNNFHFATSMKALYVFTGLFTVILNLGSAHSSYFGRENFVTEKLLQR